ncbi:hypothetical protein U0070_002142, partial [Myodes glareolus]
RSANTCSEWTLLNVRRLTNFISIRGNISREDADGDEQGELGVVELQLVHGSGELKDGIDELHLEPWGRRAGRMSSDSEARKLFGKVNNLLHRHDGQLGKVGKALLPGFPALRVSFFKRICSSDKTPKDRARCEFLLRALTLLPHARLEAFAKPTLLAFPSHVGVHGAVATAVANIACSLDDTAAEESLAALAAQHIKCWVQAGKGLLPEVSASERRLGEKLCLNRAAYQDKHQALETPATRTSLPGALDITKTLSCRNEPDTSRSKGPGTARNCDTKAQPVFPASLLPCLWEGAKLSPLAPGRSQAGPSCFVVNSNSHGSTLKHRTGAKQAASGTKTEMNGAGGKKTEEMGKSELVVGVGQKE